MTLLVTISKGRTFDWLDCSVLRDHRVKLIKKKKVSSFVILIKFKLLENRKLVIVVDLLNYNCWEVV